MACGAIPMITFPRAWTIITFKIVKTRYIEKNVSLWLLCGVQHSVMMADFIMPETQQPIIVDYLLSLPFKDLVEY